MLTHLQGLLPNQDQSLVYVTWRICAVQSADLPKAYPPDVVIGPTLLDIPAEEVFFFVIQTYIVGDIALFQLI